MELVLDHLDVADKQQQQHVEEQQEEEEQEEQHFHVLAVDDSVVERKLLERLLRVSSYQVTCVDSVDKALEYLGLLDKDSTASPSSSSKSIQQEGSRVNLIMTDFCMPGMNGYDLLKRVKGSCLKDIPVVVMSSDNIPSIITMCLEGGAEEFLLKPVELSDLEKLQPHLLKSLDNACKSTDTFGQNENDNSSNKSSNQSNFSKRKAVVSPQITDRRPKVQGLAFV
ncbi:two-component response regulator ORR9-like [Tripterygium wilfordii]|uniref:two-component response regulator ORR9-like n=1 Tax=Tripterygium wilfordii TaxID=458696 RepID=UPI0018F8258D|nr:two-component response regulator ORR9-like [Tripterygium wilfordii]